MRAETTRSNFIHKYGGINVAFLNPDVGGSMQYPTLADYIRNHMSPQRESVAKKVNSMFLPNSVQAILKEAQFVTPWWLQNHHSCSKVTKPDDNAPALLRTFDEYDADKSGHLESRTNPAALSRAVRTLQFCRVLCLMLCHVPRVPTAAQLPMHTSLWLLHPLVDEYMCASVRGDGFFGSDGVQAKTSCSRWKPTLATL